jgi:hypothetical protein
VWWAVAGGWAFAVVVAAVVLGFVGYELAWKLRRLSGDARRLQERVEELRRIESALLAAQQRLPRSLTG